MGINITMVMIILKTIVIGIVIGVNYDGLLFSITIIFIMVE